MAGPLNSVTSANTKTLLHHYRLNYSMEKLSKQGGRLRIGLLSKLGCFKPTEKFSCLHCVNQLNEWASPKSYLLVCGTSPWFLIGIISSAFATGFFACCCVKLNLELKFNKFEYPNFVERCWWNWMVSLFAKYCDLTSFCLAHKVCWSQLFFDKVTFMILFSFDSWPTSGSRSWARSRRRLDRWSR